MSRSRCSWLRAMRVSASCCESVTGPCTPRSMSCGVAADRIERRAQLVAHHREEIALRAIGVLRFLAQPIRLLHRRLQLLVRSLQLLGRRAGLLEAALQLVSGDVDLRRHLVEADAEAADLVRPGERHAPRVVALGDGFRRLRERRQRSRDAPADDDGQRRADDRQHQAQARNRDQQPARSRVHGHQWCLEQRRPRKIGRRHLRADHAAARRIVEQSGADRVARDARRRRHTRAARATGFRSGCARRC